MNTSKKNILLLGYGEMGHTMEYLFSSRHNVAIWDPYFQGKLEQINLHATAKTADFVIFCTPTVAIFELAQLIAPHLKQNCICLSMAKSLDDAGRTAPEALQQGLNESGRFGLLYGPMIAEEIMAGKPGFAMLATVFPDVATAALSLFADSILKLKPSDDVTGSAWCVILKNVYALLFGMSDGLGLGDNMRGFLAVQTLAELAEIVTLKEGRSETAYSLAGLGDLITTGTSQYSHNHALGMQLARNKRDNIGGEGVNTLNAILKLGLLNTDNHPLFKLVAQVVLDNAYPKVLLGQYIREFKR